MAPFKIRLGSARRAVSAGSLFALLVLIWIVSAPGWATAQIPGVPTGGSGAAPAEPATVPEDLRPEDVDSLLARLTDADIRALLRDELARRADAAEEAAMDPSGFAAFQQRASASIDEILERIPRWIDRVGSLHERGPQVERRLAMASDGLIGVAVAFGAVLIAGLAAAWATSLATAQWRVWLKSSSGESYWDRLIRTGALLLVELAPVAAFSVALTGVAPLFRDALGPIMASDISYLWIFEAGVTNGWAAIVFSRRAFAPDAPQLRIANVTDLTAVVMHRQLRDGVFIGLGGWLIAGLFPTFGYGFPPAMLTVTLAGTAIFLAMCVNSVLRFQDVAQASARMIGVGSDVAGPFDAEAQQGAPASRVILRAIAPWLLIGYVVFAYLYWASHWITTGQQHLLGPLGTVFVVVTLPAFDRLGAELVRAALSRSSEVAQRFHSVLRGAWRVVLGLAAVGVIARLWGVDLLAFAKGEDAPPWASAAFDIAVALLIGQLIWRLVEAALYREKRATGADMEEMIDEVAGASRLDTLIPLLRNALLIVLVVVVFMIVLSSLGMDIGPLLASAGIIGIAIGFGAQTLVRDIFSGAFFLIDDAFRVGEYIELDAELRGEVEAISVRSLQLRHHRGPVITIPFGELKNVTNHSRDWVIYKMSFRLEPDTDPAKVKKVVKRIGFELMEDPEHGPKFLEPLKSQGVFMIDEDSALVIRVKFKSKPRMQFVLRREVYHRLRAAFAENDIRFARRKVEVVSNQDGLDEGAAAEAATTTTGPSALTTAGAQP